MNKESILFSLLEFQESGDVAESSAERAWLLAQHTMGLPWSHGLRGEKDNGRQQTPRPRGVLSHRQPEDRRRLLFSDPQ